jgi:hypothetical protein
VQRQKVKETDRFVTKTASGQRCTVVEYTTYLEADSFEGPSWIEGTKKLRTTNNLSVNFRGPGHYDLLDGTKLTRV